MPLNLAVFGADRANDVINAYPQIQHWAVGGHSLGGAMAARYANTHPDRVQGLVLYASYPDTSNNLSQQKIAVVSIFGTSDGVATPNKVEGAKPLLPSDALFVPIEGGDHSQFGWYGLQPGDNPAAISRQEQQAQAVNATLDLLAKLGSSGS
jgi:pimeloyl-ACP methyl ester carboxylesterase